MKVSIITATYNSSGTVRDSILSVKQQTYGNIEHIIVDGLSVDNTLELIKNEGHHGPLISEKDGGIYDAMNKGVKMASGDIIGILNSDDFYPHPDIIKTIVDEFIATNCDAVYGDLIYVEPGKVYSVYRTWKAGNFKPELFYKGWMPPHPTVFLRKEVYEKFGTFNTSLKSSSDYELLIRLLLKHRITVSYIPEVLVHMRAGGASNDTLKARFQAHSEDYKAWEMNDLLPKWYTLSLKPLRKLNQYFVNKDIKDYKPMIIKNVTRVQSILAGLF